MIKRFLCLLGLHTWETLSENRIVRVLICPVCFKTIYKGRMEYKKWNMTAQWKHGKYTTTMMNMQFRCMEKPGARHWQGLVDAGLIVISIGCSCVVLGFPNWITYRLRARTQQNILQMIWQVKHWSQNIGLMIVIVRCVPNKK